MIQATVENKAQAELVQLKCREGAKMLADPLQRAGWGQAG